MKTKPEKEKRSLFEKSKGMSKMEEHSIKTRKIYEKQHERIVANDEALSRIKGLYETNTFGINSYWFRKKKSLDAGCGNVGALMMRLVNLGVSKVSGIDIGTDWIPKLESSLLKNGISKNKYELKSGSVIDIPYGDEYFDFVAINGVLIHLKDMAEILRGFSEGARVCKRGGYYFTSFGPCGGCMQEVIFPALRKHYKDNADFHNFIDNINPKEIHQAIDKICVDAKKYTGDVYDANLLKSLFGEDFCVFLQNFIQAPTWYSNECTPELVEELYRQHGFVNVTRLHNYVKRKDIRKFFAPLHYDIKYPLSQILYGKGYVTYVGQKD